MSSKKHSLDSYTKRLSDQSFIQRTVRDMKMAFWLFQQRDVPILTKIVPFLGLAYVLAPVDLIPDFIPILGQFDDIAIIVLGVRAFVRLAPPPVVGRYEASQTGLTVIENED